jgi:hypothetical protein
MLLVDGRSAGAGVPTGNSGARQRRMWYSCGSESVEFAAMNVLVDATYRRHISELWMQYQRGLFPPKQPGEVRILVEPPMHGPDARNLLNFFGAPEDFVRLLKQNRIPHTVN